MRFPATHPYTHSLAHFLYENIIFQSVRRIFPASPLLTTYLLRTQLGGQ